MYPTERKTAEERKKCKGVMIHIHGGGWIVRHTYEYNDLK